jgi:GrpB-like predicted nucleotidyltransferase (UPF0157 family)
MAGAVRAGVREDPERPRGAIARDQTSRQHRGQGLAAKPVIDMLVAVDSMARASRYALVLVEYGYEEVAAGSDRHAYMTAKGDFIVRTTAVAIREQGADRH